MCTAALLSIDPGKAWKVTRAKLENTGDVNCFIQATAPGDDRKDNSTYGSAEYICPENSLSNFEAKRCDCRSSYFAKNGKCVTQQEAATEKVADPLPRTKEELLATPQNRDPEGCGLTKQQQQAIASILGKRFSSIPQFNKAWLAAVKVDDAKAVARLRPDPATNKANRIKYFSGTRRRFWENVFDDKAKDGAYELVTRAGGMIAKRGNAAKLNVNGKIQGLDVDHLVGLAEDPTKMISVANMQLSPAKENRDALEEIARVDPFYDPDEWLRKQAAATCPVKPKSK